MWTSYKCIAITTIIKSMNTKNQVTFYKIIDKKW